MLVTLNTENTKPIRIMTGGLMDGGGGGSGGQRSGELGI